MSGRTNREEVIPICPAEGRRIRHPDGRVLDARGETLSLNTHWRRLIAAGDAIIMTAAPRAIPKGRKS